MKTSDLLFVGIKGSVVALNRETGELVWTKSLKGSDFVNVAVEAGKIFASCAGELFCIDPLTGAGLWHNRLKGFGTGLATIATEDTVRSTLSAVLAEKHRRDQAAATAAASAATASAA